MQEPVPSQAAFVHAVMAALDVTQTELGEDLGQANAYNQAHAWLTEKSGLHYAEMVRMLYAAGFLTEEARQALLAAQAAVAAEKGATARGAAASVQRRLRRHRAIARLRQAS